MKLMIALLLLLPYALTAQDDDRIKRLEERIKKLEADQSDDHDADEDEHHDDDADDDHADEDEHHDEDHEQAPDIWFHRSGDITIRLIDIQLNGLFAAGHSSVKNEYVRGLQAGGHDPMRRGFTLQEVKLSMFGAIEPVFSFDFHLIVGEEGVELEEAFFETMALPYGFEVRGGYFQTEFGIHNPTHAHDWDFVDTPVANSRLLGPDGTRGLGYRVTWQAPLPWDLEILFGMQNANDDSMVSFLGEGHVHGDGDHDDEHGEEGLGGYGAVERDVESFHEFLYLVRVAQEWEVVQHATFGFGLSGLYGANRSGDTGKTWIAGADLLFTWTENAHAKDAFFVRFRGEAMYRYYQADAYTNEGDPLDPLDDERFASTVLGDWGGYAQVMLGWNQGWQFGVRAEFNDAFREGEHRRVEDSLRDRRYRASVLVEWEIIEATRIRLQYNFDHMEHLRHSTAHSVWFSVEIFLGKHLAH